jgi:RNA polymerase sigma-70 factor, ECF subfamily
VSRGPRSDDPDPRGVDGVAADPLDGLVDAVRAGDPEAIAEVYLVVAPGLRGYLRRQVRHGEVADDLVEQTFLELLESAHGLRAEGGAALRAWLYRAARHNLLDWRRRAERRSDHELRARHTASLVDPTADDPAEVASSADPALEAALAQLTALQREVLELRLVADLPVAEVARITGRTRGAVALVQHRALRRLASLLDADAAPRDGGRDG